MTAEKHDPWTDLSDDIGDGRRAVIDHLGAVVSAAAHIGDDIARKIVLQSAETLRKAAAKDKVLDRYHETGNDPIRACRGPLITRAVAKCDETRYASAVHRLVECGWLTKASGTGRRGVALYLFTVGETWSGPAVAPAVHRRR